MQHAEKVVADAGRRSFVIGDPRDTRTPFPEQRAWSEKLASLGHHVALIEGVATDPEHHGQADEALAAAALCAKGRSDDEIRAAVKAQGK